MAGTKRVETEVESCPENSKCWLFAIISSLNCNQLVLLQMLLPSVSETLWGVVISQWKCVEEGVKEAQSRGCGERKWWKGILT